MDESGASAHAACLLRPPGRRRLTACRRSGVSALSFVPAYIAANNAAYTNTCVASPHRRRCRRRRRAPLTAPLSLCHFPAGSRVFAALVAGCVAGVLGLTDIRGFLAYLFAMALVRLRSAARLRA